LRTVGRSWKSFQNPFFDRVVRSLAVLSESSGPAQEKNTNSLRQVAGEGIRSGFAAMATALYGPWAGRVAYAATGRIGRRVLLFCACLCLVSPISIVFLIGTSSDFARASEECWGVECGVMPQSVNGMYCPVAGRPNFSDTWHAPRSGGRKHKGVDMFAPAGTPVLAVADGVIFKASPVSRGLGGITL